LRYKAERFLPVIDQFIAFLDQRLQAYKLLAGQFGCFGCLSTLSPEELLTAAKTLVESYQMISPLMSYHCQVADIFKDDEPRNISTIFCTN